MLTNEGQDREARSNKMNMREGGGGASEASDSCQLSVFTSYSGAGWEVKLTVVLGSFGIHIQDFLRGRKSIITLYFG